MTVAPVRVPENRVPDVFRGGARIDAFRHRTVRGDGPEDWVGSLTLASEGFRRALEVPLLGLSRLEDGTVLRDLVRAGPEAWLGTTRTNDPRLLVKLLDAGERLPVHYHPSDPFAREHLGAENGKSEAWVIIDAEPGAALWLGFAQDVHRKTVRRWIENQDTLAMLDGMNRLAVKPGDVLYVPSGIPHVVGAGILLCELQQPSSMNFFLEYEDIGLQERAAHLGVGWDAALDSLDLAGYADGGLASLRPAPRLLSSGVEELLPAEASEYFQALRVQSSERVEVGELGYAIVLALRGRGQLEWDGGSTEVSAGQTWVLPSAAGRIALSGTLEVLACLPALDG